MNLRSPTVLDAVRRSHLSFQVRQARLRAKSWQIMQCAVAAGVAWWAAQTFLGHPQPFFAPVVALVSLGITYGQRLRRLVEMSVGVALGIFLGDVYTHIFGRGAWQITVMVGVAITLAVLLDTSPLLMNQAAVQSLVVVTVLPNSTLAFSRWTDALVGGAVAVLAASIVPSAPFRRPGEQAAVVMSKIASILRDAEVSIRSGDPKRALTALLDARSTDVMLEELRTAAAEGLSVVASSPFRRRKSATVRFMVEITEPLDFAMRNARVLVRRVAVANLREERVPTEYLVLIGDLAEICSAIAKELRGSKDLVAVTDALLALAERSAVAPRSEELSAVVVLAQVRSIIADLLSLCGMDPIAATESIPSMDYE